MKQGTTISKGNGLDSQAPLAIIKWPTGLSGSPVILPIGETFEESEQILELPEGAVLD